MHRPAATSSIVPTSTRFMCRRNMSASIQNSSTSPTARHSQRDDPAVEVGVLGFGGRERGEVVRAEQRGGAALERVAVDGRGPPVGAPTLEHGARAPRQHAVAVGPAGGVAARVEASGRWLGGEHGDVAVEQAVEAQRVDRLVRVARDLAPRVHAARRCARRRSAVSGRSSWPTSPSTVRSARSSSSCTVRLSRLARPAGEVGAVVLDRELGDHPRAAFRCRGSALTRGAAETARPQTSSMKTISVASLRRGPSLRMRV